MSYDCSMFIVASRALCDARYDLYIDNATIYDPLTTFTSEVIEQSFLIDRYGHCAYVIGAHPQSTVQQPLVTLTQWYSTQAQATPVILDQVMYMYPSRPTHPIPCCLRSQIQLRVSYINPICIMSIP
jgi:hypothetical protein